MHDLITTRDDCKQEPKTNSKLVNALVAGNKSSRYNTKLIVQTTMAYWFSGNIWKQHPFYLILKSFSIRTKETFIQMKSSFIRERFRGGTSTHIWRHNLIFQDWNFKSIGVISERHARRLHYGGLVGGARTLTPNAWHWLSLTNHRRKFAKKRRRRAIRRAGPLINPLEINFNLLV